MCVSIIIPVFNRAGRVAAALESVRKQTYQDWEAIVVDDGSTDQSRELIRKVAKCDSRLRLLGHDQNRGAQAARNTGILAATGDWIAFLDSDDEYLPDSLERRMKLAVKENVLVVHSECYKIFEDGRMELFGVPPLRGHIYRKLLVGAGPMFQGMLVRKTTLKRIGYLDEKIKSFQEWDTAIRLAKYYEFGFENDPTFIYDCRGGDTISKQLSRNAQGYAQVFYKHFLAILRHNGSIALAYHYAALNQLYRAGGDYRKARISAILSLVCKCLSSSAVLSRLQQLCFSNNKIKGDGLLF